MCVVNLNTFFGYVTVGYSIIYELKAEQDKHNAILTCRLVKIKIKGESKLLVLNIGWRNIFNVKNELFIVKTAIIMKENYVWESIKKRFF